MQILPNEIVVDVDVGAEGVDKKKQQRNQNSGRRQEQSNKVSAGNTAGAGPSVTLPNVELDNCLTWLAHKRYRHRV